MSSRWQPIETAPKDGTRILLFWPSWTYEVQHYGDRPEISIGWWTTNSRLSTTHADGWPKHSAGYVAQLKEAAIFSDSYFTDQSEQDCYGQAQSHNAPTYWQPLPKPPTNKDDK